MSQDMEDAFPWLDDAEDRAKQIFDILYKCWTEDDAYSNPAEGKEPLKSCVYAICPLLFQLCHFLYSLSPFPEKCRIQ